MTIRVGITGFGRIGRCVLRAWLESKRSDIEVVALNFRRTVEDKMRLLQYDSTHGRLNANITIADEEHITIDEHKIRVFHEDQPSNIGWNEARVDVVLECTGVFKAKEQASQHLGGSVSKVLISAPAPDPDATIVLGVNEETLTGAEQVISVGSCTTNCLAPVAKVLQQHCGIAEGFMTTIHAYTSDQTLLDNSHKNPRRARSAALSMIPTSTGAAKALGLVLPELQGKLDGTSIRVPTPNVSLVDLVFNAERTTDPGAITRAMQEASSGNMQDILGICSEPLVSIDFNHSPYSGVFDTTQTHQVRDNLFRVAAWYDNEWGFSNRMLDLAARVG